MALIVGLKNIILSLLWSFCSMLQFTVNIAYNALQITSAIIEKKYNVYSQVMIAACYCPIEYIMTQRFFFY